MKKKYIYFVIPLIALVLFGAYYWNFSKGLAAREAKRLADIELRKKEKLHEQDLRNQEAIRQAQIASAKRKAEREAKEAKDKADKDARANAVELRNKAERDAAKLAQQVERLEKDVQTEQANIAKLESDKTKANAELVFLREYVKQAEDNARSLNQVIDKISAADIARAAADAAAAAAAKKNSNS